MVKVHQTGEVFVAGGTPSVTYNPRQSRQIERTVERYLSENGKALTVHGASKSGKTSLVERMLPPVNAVWLQGQDIETLDDFWGQLGMRLGIAENRQQSATDEQSVGTQFGAKVTVGPIAEGSWQRSDTDRSARTVASSNTTHIAEAVRAKLSENQKPIVIDDFHFIDDSIKRSISRAIKTIVRHSPLILIAVPSEAFELVRTEPEMSGRVWSLPIPDWSVEELAQIGSSGFSLLNLNDSEDDVARRLARVSYASPFIMQQLCHDLVRWELEITETGPMTDLTLPKDFERFLAETADRAAPPIFPRLLAGPARKGTERKPVVLSSSHTNTDIYGAVLSAIKALTPKLQHPERSVSAEVQRITDGKVTTQRVNNALKQMNKIAFERRGSSDPVLRLRDDTLFIQDSMLAFYLAHGSWSPEKLDL